MLAGKMKEIKKSIRRVYMRLFVLGAVVIFGAIALAQAQKDTSGGDESTNRPGPLPAETQTTPITRVSGDRLDTDGQVEPANVQFAETEGNTVQWRDSVPEDSQAGWPPPGSKPLPVRPAGEVPGPGR